jgi:hypothetical protein
MGFIERELSRVRPLLAKHEMESPEWKAAYIAQQALCWALDPQSAASPYVYLTGDRSDPVYDEQSPSIPTNTPPPPRACAKPA